MTRIPVRSLEEKFKYLADKKNGRNPLTEKRVIRRVPLMLRNRKNLIQYFEPRGVSIGPIHYGQENLQPAEDLKSKLAMDFIENSGYSIEQLYELVESNIQNFAEFYADEVRQSFSYGQLAWILFVDGCALLHFIRHVVYPRHQILKKLNIKNDLVAFAQQDAFLLENQLPFRLLELLMSKNRKGATLWKSIQRFVQMNAMVMPNDKFEEPKSPPLHLLDLLRTTLLFRGSSNEQEHSTSVLRVEQEVEVEEEEEGWPTFRNIQELKTTGIYVKRVERRKGLDIEFKRRIWAGRLEIPGIRVDDSTQPKLLNLVAYEMCPEFQNDFEVTSYICLLDSLIDQAEDVKELRKANIIQNLLGSDEELAKLFNEIGTDLVPNPEIYWKVKKKMQTHFNNRLSKWIAEAYHNYFSSPWSFLAFIGVLIGLICSLIQAWYAPKSDPPCACSSP